MMTLICNYFSLWQQATLTKSFEFFAFFVFTPLDSTPPPPHFLWNFSNFSFVPCVVRWLKNFPDPRPRIRKNSSFQSELFIYNFRNSSSVSYHFLWRSSVMANVRDSDTSLWLHNKLGTSNDSWTGGSICSQLNSEVLRNIKECFPDLQTQVKLKLLLSFFQIPHKNIQEVSTGILKNTYLLWFCVPPFLFSVLIMPNNLYNLMKILFSKGLTLSGLSLW